MIILPQAIFSEFKNKILESTYFPTNPVDTLKARLTATWLLQAENTAHSKLAKIFIRKTSSCQNQDLARLEELASQVTSWDGLQICSMYTNVSGMYLEYKLLLTTGDGLKQTMHFHARYETQDQLCRFVSQTAPLIRITGDPILQKPGVTFPVGASAKHQEELSRQIELAKSVLIQTGGAGIAANQCAGIEKPYNFTIVGVFHNILEHVTGVQKRYPSIQFPQAIIMVNPVITAMSQEMQQFNHACLSVPCANRCTVLSPMTISVTYQDPLEKMGSKSVTFTGVNAVVLWHELTHIVYGKTYMDVTFDALSMEDLIRFQEMSQQEIVRRQTENYTDIPELSVPPFHISVKVNTDGIPKLDSAELSKVLPNITTDTLSGLIKQAQASLKKKQLTSKSLREFSETFFRAETNRNMACGEEQSNNALSKL